MDNVERADKRWIGFAAAAWAFIFGVFHILWALGWYIGLDPEQARVAFAKPAFMIYDLVIVGACGLGTWVTLALVMPWGRRMPPRLLRVVVWTGAVLLVLRAGASAIHMGYSMGRGQFRVAAVGIWEPWFLVGAILFTATAWRLVAPIAAETAVPRDGGE